jgi:hypothetical protein
VHPPALGFDNWTEVKVDITSWNHVWGLAAAAAAAGKIRCGEHESQIVAGNKAGLSQSQKHLLFFWLGAVKDTGGDALNCDGDISSLAVHYCFASNLHHLC